MINDLPKELLAAFAEEYGGFVDVLSEHQGSTGRPPGELAAAALHGVVESGVAAAELFDALPAEAEATRGVLVTAIGHLAYVHGLLGLVQGAVNDER